MTVHINQYRFLGWNSAGKESTRRGFPMPNTGRSVLSSGSKWDGMNVERWLTGLSKYKLGMSRKEFCVLPGIFFEESRNVFLPDNQLLSSEGIMGKGKDVCQPLPVEAKVGSRSSGHFYARNSARTSRGFSGSVPPNTSRLLGLMESGW